MIETFREAGILDALDVHFAEAIRRLGHAEDERVLLGAALAARAPVRGHVCVDLVEAPASVRVEIEEGTDALDLPWPEPVAWRAALAAADPVRSPDEDRRTPLVLAGDRLYLDRYWRYQQRLVDALRTRLTPREDVDEALLRAGLQRLFERPGQQAVAAAMATLRSFAVISGGPGTGKTYTVVRILALLIEQALARGAPPPRIALAAPTGKAASRMAESAREARERGFDVAPQVADAIPDKGTTLHSLLGMRPGKVGARFDAQNPLAYDVVVVDEASMVDLSMMSRLFQAVPPEARLVLLGDRDQLASVEAGAVLGDLCPAAGRGPTAAWNARLEVALGAPANLGVSPGDAPGIWDGVVQLTETHRFDEDSGIQALAEAINAGDGAETVRLLQDPGHGDVQLVAADDEILQPLATEGFRDATVAHAPDVALRALGRFRILCAHRRGRLGVGPLSRRVEAWLQHAGCIDPTTPWYRGRPILVTRNDRVLGLHNGDAGIVLERPDGDRACFDGASGHREFSPARLPPHETVYATTVHKSQGSEFDHVLVVLPEVRSPILTRELLYTAVTRARRRVTIAATPEVVAASVAERVQRFSGLREQLWGS